MTANTVARFCQSEIAPAIIKTEVVYTVTAKTRNGKVTVDPTGLYECSCMTFNLYGDCEHAKTVQAQRKAEGRKF